MYIPEHSRILVWSRRDMAKCPLRSLPFPDCFRWGVATSANQIEGSTAVRK